ncbi:hypothetical protein Syun_000454 [Stephania yunnanensis]|uniref:Uncharacterized protein n=1 Tax=Stephania yunnanensis TaxID=152371 RepID=A0AAP0LG13_9MAGN
MFTSFHQLSPSLRPFKIQSTDAALSSTLAAPNTSIASNPFLSFLRFRSIRRSNLLSLPSFSITMSAGGDDAGAPYQEALDALSALITKRQRADKSNNGDCFELMSDYVKILGLEDDISGMKVIHVAGTKGKENANEDVPMPSFFRFIALLAFKIFSAEQHGVPAFTVPQPDEAMAVLEQKASELNLVLVLKMPLFSLEKQSSLPDQFINGLATAHLLGRAQIVLDPYIDEDSYENLIFYLDGAHSPESMEVCGKWFSQTIDEVVQQNNSLEGQLLDSSRDPHGLVQKDPNETSKKNTKQILCSIACRYEILSFFFHEATTMLEMLSVKRAAEMLNTVLERVKVVWCFLRYLWL